MDQIVILDGLEQDRLLRAIESAIHVRRRHQLFLWVQGQFFALLPHEILVCLRLERGDGGSRASHIESLHCMLFEEAQEEYLCHPQTGLAVRLVRACEDCGLLPGLVAEGISRSARVFDAFRDDLARAGLRNAIVHGHRINGQNDATFFVLFNLSEEVMPAHGHLFRLMLPHLHLAYSHVIGQDKEDNLAETGDPAADMPITGRQLEVLRWVGSGKNSQEIAAILNISHLTVKNHMQKIFRKFNVHSRAQAVSKAMALNLFRDAG